MIGMNKTLDEFTYADGDINRLIVESFYEVDFQGLTDRIRFSVQGRTSGFIGISQQIGKWLCNSEKCFK